MEKEGSEDRDCERDDESATFHGNLRGAEPLRVMRCGSCVEQREDLRVKLPRTSLAAMHSPAQGACPVKLLLIDGHYYVYRSFFAIQSLSNSRGEPTNAIYGFLKTVRKMIKDVQPDRAAVLW